MNNLETLPWPRITVADIEAEIERRKRNRIVNVFPDAGPLRRELYTKHLEFFADGARFRVREFRAANRVGKSIAGAYETVCHLTGKYPHWWVGKKFTRPVNVLVAGETGRLVRDSIQMELCGAPSAIGTGMIPAQAIFERRPKTGIPDAIDTCQIRHISGGMSILQFQSFDQGREAFQATARDVCIAAGELVQMSDGRLVPIEDVKPGDMVVGMDWHGNIVSRKVTAVHDNGMKGCIDLRSKQGGGIMLTPDHMIYHGVGAHDKIRADISDKIAQIPLGAFWPTATDDRSPAWYVWAALYISAGYSHQNRITNGNLEAINKAISLLPRHARASRILGMEWHLWWDEFWGTIKGGFQKKIPDWVFRSSKDCVRLFLRWLYMGVSLEPGKSICYATTSRMVASQLVVLLNRLGIVAETRVQKKQYLIDICDVSAIERFLEEVGIESKEEACRLVLEEINSEATRGTPNDRVISSPVVEREKVGSKRVYDLSVEGEHRFFVGTNLVSNCWLDEEPPLAVYSEALTRTMTTGGVVYVTFTPLKGMSDTVLFLEEQAKEGKVSLVTASWDNAPHLSEADKAEMLAAYPPHQRDARTKGIPALGSGAIYPVPETEFITPPLKLPVHWRRGYALDVGWNRTAAIFFAYDDDTDVLYFYDEHYRGQAEPSVHADAIKARGTWMHGVIDPASRGRSQKDGEQLLSIYKEMGLNIIPADNSVEAGIYEFYQRLSSGRLKVFSNLVNFMNEYRLYRRDEKGKIVKENDHLMDAGRYAVFSGIDVAQFSPEWKEKTWGAKANGHSVSYDPLSRSHWQQDFGTKQKPYDPLARGRY